MKDKIKNNKLFSILFVNIMTLFCILVRVFSKKEKKIIFSSFAGRQYSDSPKAIYEMLKSDSRFSEYKLVWAFVEPEKFENIENKVSANSLSFFKELMSASVWVSNASIERLIPYKPKRIFYLNSWHGVPLKKIGKDEKDVPWMTSNWYEKAKIDYCTTVCDLDEDVFKKVFPSCEKFERTGLPRNYFLLEKLKESQTLRKSFINNYGISEDKRLVLYAPTFRNGESKEENLFFDKNFENKIPENTIVLIRPHYFELSQNINNTNIIDVSDSDLNELMSISDCLITDYSSIMFDYYLTSKPIYLYCYDYENYSTTRGMYFDIFKEKNTYNVNNSDVLEVLEKDESKFTNNKYLDELNMKKNIDMTSILDVLYNNL